LTDDLVLVDTLLGGVGLFQFDAEFQVFGHDLLVLLLPCSMLLAVENIAKKIKSTGVVADLDEFC